MSFQKLDEQEFEIELLSLFFVFNLMSLEVLLVRLTLEGFSHQALEPGTVLPELPQQL